MLHLPELTVVLPIHNGYEAVCRCLHSLHNDARPLDAAITSLVLIDDASTDPRIAPLLREFHKQVPQVQLIEQCENLGYLASVNRQLERIKGCVILLNSDTIVTKDWATRLQEGALRYPRLGALTPLSNHATFNAIRDPDNPRRGLERHDLPRIEALIETRAGCDYPIAPTGMGFCLLITPLARSIVPTFDPCFAPGYEEENDLCQTLRAHGLQCRIATDVYVHHEGGESFGAAKADLQKRHYQLIQQRHPAYAALVQDWFERLDTPHTLLPATNPKPLRLLLEAEVLRQSLTGVVRYLHTLIELLTPTIECGELQVSAVVADTATQQRYKSSTPQVEWIIASELETYGRDWDVYHVCHANISPQEVQLRRRHASRLVVTLHDLIAFENPSYFPNGGSFLDYRQQLRELTGLADHVLAISNNTQRDGLEQLPLDPLRCSVFTNPLIHLQRQLTTSVQTEKEETERFCLIVGTDFRHKHLLGSVRLFQNALLTLDPQLKLVLVGPEVAHGGTISELKAWLNRDTNLAKAIRFEGAVNDARLQSLYQSAELVLYLSLQEGFGYIPYEAAMHNCPTLVANTSVYSKLPNWVAVDPYPCTHTNTILKALLNEPANRSRNVHLWQQLLAKDHQRNHARELMNLYRKVLNTAMNPYADWLIKPQSRLLQPHTSKPRLRHLINLVPRNIKTKLRRSADLLKQQKMRLSRHKNN